MESGKVQIKATKGYGRMYNTVSLFTAIYGYMDDRIFLTLSDFC